MAPEQKIQGFLSIMKKVSKKEIVLKIAKITEHKDGSATYDFIYKQDFIDMVKKYLKLDKEPTKKQIEKFLLDALEEMVKCDKKI